MRRFAGGFLYCRANLGAVGISNHLQFARLVNNVVPTQSILVSAIVVDRLSPLGINTQLGNVKYFCKAKNKKNISEGDLSTALVNAQSKGLPLLFITNGKTSKKSQEKLKTDFKNIVYREL